MGEGMSQPGQLYKNYIEMGEGMSQPGQRLITATTKVWRVVQGRTVFNSGYNVPILFRNIRGLHGVYNLIEVISSCNLFTNLKHTCHIRIYKLECILLHSSNTFTSANVFSFYIFALLMFRWFGLWCLTPLLTIFQLYRGCQFYSFKHILLFNKKQLDRTQVSQLRNVFSNIYMN